MDTIQAIVQKVVPRGRHGPYAIATCDELTGSVTFSLEPTVWTEEDWPEEGNVVLLSKLRQKRAGWRAKAGRFTRPSDEQQAKRKERKMTEEHKGVDIVATVRHIVTEGEGAPYAIAIGHLTHDGRKDEVLIPLTAEAWQEAEQPQVGQEIFGATLYYPSEDSRSIARVKTARFALPSDPRKQQEVDESLVHDLSFERGSVFVSGKKVLEVPLSDQQVCVVGHWQYKNSPLDVGTGACCHGHVYHMNHYSEEQGYTLGQVIAVDLNVYDLIRACADYKVHHCGNGDSVLVTGYGCAGGGVRLVTMYYPHVMDVVSTDEFNQYMPGGGGHAKPMFRFDQKEWRIYLDFLRAGYRLKPGQARDPKLPSLLLDSKAEEWYVDRSDVIRSVDLTDKLRIAGVHIDETICMADDYRRQHGRS